MDSTVQIFALVCFGLALVHTFSVKGFQRLGNRCPSGSVSENLFHLLGEVEVVFGLWAAIFLFFYGLRLGVAPAIEYLRGRDFTEPAFVFIVLCVCATRPVLSLSHRLIDGLSRRLPLPEPIAFYATALVVGPLLGSFITEPAAMTVTALILLERFYRSGISRQLRYATLGLLFVNVSIGGTLTPYAAPPVLMVAREWGWDLGHMLGHFGWKAVIAVLLSTAWTAFRHRAELRSLECSRRPDSNEPRIPLWVSGTHLVFLVLIVMSAHVPQLCLGVFLFFLGLVKVTEEYQEPLRLREGLLVGFFLGGLVVIGGAQSWWLEPLLMRLNELWMFLGSASLTAVTDNAALTYLGAQVPSLSEASRYALVSGAVVGGGLTVIANAPNPAGYGILQHSFGEEGISPLLLFVHALLPTLVAGACFWFL